MCRASKEFRCVGNSGVSIWRRDVMARFVASRWFVYEWGPRQHLDVYMSHKLQNANQASSPVTLCDAEPSSFAATFRPRHQLQPHRLTAPTRVCVILRAVGALARRWGTLWTSRDA